jgi:hypothetical protein
MTTTGATLLVAVVSYVNNVTPTLSDSKSNTWTGLTAKTIAGQQTSRIFYVSSPIVGTSHTFTLTGASIIASIVVMAFSGIQTSSPFDKENGATLAGSGTSLASGSITPSVDGDLIIIALSTGGNPTTNGQTNVDVLSASIFVGGAAVTNNGSYYGTEAGFGIQGTAASINSTWTLTGTGINANLVALIASFKAAPYGYLLVN